MKRKDENEEEYLRQIKLIEFYFTHKWSFAGNRTDDDGELVIKMISESFRFNDSSFVRAAIHHRD